jgi:hypothetical protein
MNLLIAIFSVIMICTTAWAQTGSSTLPRLVIPPISPDGNLPDGFYVIRRAVDAKNKVTEYKEPLTKEYVDGHDGNMSIKFNGRNIIFHETICEVKQTTPSNGSTTIQAICGHYGDEETRDISIKVFSSTQRLAIMYIGKDGQTGTTEEYERIEDTKTVTPKQNDYFDASKWIEYSRLMKYNEKTNASPKIEKPEWVFNGKSVNNNRAKEFSQVDVSKMPKHGQNQTSPSIPNSPSSPEKAAAEQRAQEKKKADEAEAKRINERLANPIAPKSASPSWTIENKLDNSKAEYLHVNLEMKFTDGLKPDDEEQFSISVRV